MCRVFCYICTMATVNLNINLSLEQLLKAVKQLSPSERLKVNDALWESNTEIPAEHQQLVLSRIEAAKKNPDLLLNWDEVSKDL